MLDVIENQRSIISRRAELVRAKQAIRERALELSLYYRDAQGQPQIVEASRLPKTLELVLPPDLARLGRDEEQLLKRRPEFSVFEALEAIAQLEQQAAENMLQPSLDLSVGVAQDIEALTGVAGIWDNGGEVKMGVKFSLPIERRKARGKSQAAEARRLQIQTERRLLLDVLRAQLRAEHLALQAAFEEAKLREQEVDLAERAAAGERKRQAGGDSDQLKVTLRELKRAEASRKWIKARATARKRWTSYQVTAGQRPK
jgi:outer membrane protein TolC